MNYLFIITGPSGCGKTTLLRKLEDMGKWVKATKLSSRLPRAGEHDAAGYTDVTTPFIESDSTAEDVEKAKKRMRERISAECNVIYYMNNELYGFNSNDILNRLESDHVAIILSDLGVIKSLKDDPRLRDRIIVLYISSSVTKEQLTEVWISRYKDFQGRKRSSDERTTLEEKDVAGLIDKLENCIEELSKEENKLEDTEKAYSKRFFHYYQLLREAQFTFERLMPDSESYRVRVDRIQNFYYKYIIDIGLFDYVILNYFDVRADLPEDEKMSTQACSIIDYLDHETPEERSQRQIRPRDAIFFVCAAPKSGKNILMTNLHVMSEKHIQIVPKEGLREKKSKDGQDKMTPIIERRNDETQREYETRKEEIKAFLSEEKSKLDEYEVRKQKIAEKYESLAKTLPAVEGIWATELEKLEKEKSEFETRMTTDSVDGAVKFFDPSYQKWVWKFHGKFYGVDTNMIDSYAADRREQIGEPIMPIIMISNMYQLDRARELYGNRLVPIFLTYVSSDKGNEDFHLHEDRIAEGFYKNSEEARETVREIKAIKEEYFRNIGKFRHVLLNSGVDEDLHDQIINIVRLYQGK